MLMRKSTFSLLTVIILASFTLLQSCKDDSFLLEKPGVADQSFSEDFDTASAAIARGWHFINTSVPIGGGVWQQGGGLPPWFQAYSSHGSYVGFLGADYTSTSAAAGIISNWLVSPPVIMQNGDKIVFYTRGLLYYSGVGTDSTDYANRLQLNINQYNDYLTVGNGDDPGDFKNTLVDINSNYEEFHTDPNLYSPTAYPSSWTRFEGTVSGLNGPVRGRFAFRYFVEGAGSNGLGSGVAIDKVSYISVNHH
jgi:hypothetical protein